LTVKLRPEWDGSTFQVPGVSELRSAMSFPFVVVSHLLACANNNT
jgi:hypothetical protein